MKKYYFFIIGILLLGSPFLSHAAILVDTTSIPTSTAEYLLSSLTEGTRSKVYFNVGQSNATVVSGDLWLLYPVGATGGFDTPTYYQVSPDNNTGWPTRAGSAVTFSTNESGIYPGWNIAHWTGVSFSSGDWLGLNANYAQTDNTVFTDGNGTFYDENSENLTYYDGVTIGCFATTEADLANCAAIGSGTSTPSVSFVYPENGTTTPPFSPWLLSFTGLAPTTSYQVAIHWQRTNHGCGYNGLYFSTFNCTIYGDTSGIFSGNTTGTIAVPRPDRDLGYEADGYDEDNWTATGYLYNLTQGGGFISTSSVSFTLLRNAIAGNPKQLSGNGTTTYYIPSIGTGGTLQITTSTNNYTTIVGSLSNTSSTCNGDTIGLCPAMAFFLQPHTDFQTAFNDEIAVSKTKFPLSIVFSFANAASSSLNGSSTATDTLSFTIPAYGPSPTTSIVIMSPTIMTDNGVSQQAKDLYFDVSRKVLWLTTGIGALIIPFM